MLLSRGKHQKIIIKFIYSHVFVSTALCQSFHASERWRKNSVAFTYSFIKTAPTWQIKMQQESVESRQTCDWERRCHSRQCTLTPAVTLIVCFCPGAKVSAQTLRLQMLYHVCWGETHSSVSSHAPTWRSAAPCTLCAPLFEPCSFTFPFSGSCIPRIKYATQKPRGPRRNKADSYRGNIEQQRHTTSRWWTAHSRRPVHRCYFLSKHKEGEKNPNMFLNIRKVSLHIHFLLKGPRHMTFSAKMSWSNEHLGFIRKRNQYLSYRCLLTSRVFVQQCKTVWAKCWRSSGKIIAHWATQYTVCVFCFLFFF